MFFNYNSNTFSFNMIHLVLNAAFLFNSLEKISAFEYLSLPSKLITITSLGVCNANL